MVIPKINSAHGSDTRNILNRAIDSTNAQGKAIQDLVAKGQLTPTQYATLIESINGLIKKGQLSVDDIDINKGRIGLRHLEAEVKAAMSGDTPILSEVAPASITDREVYPGSLTPNSVDFITTGKNKFNKHSVTDGVYINENNGDFINHPDFVTSDFIPVKMNQTFTINFVSKVIFYDLNQNWVSGVGQTQILYTGSASQDGFVRISIDKRRHNYQDAQFEFGSSVTAFENFGYVLDKDIEISNVKVTDLSDGSVNRNTLSDGAVSYDKTDFISVGKNLLNPLDLQRNKLVTISGLVDSDIYHSSHKIYLKKDDDVSINKFRNMVFFNNVDVPLLQSFDELENYSFKAPDDGYLLITIRVENELTTQVEYGTKSTTFEPFKLKLSESIQTGNGIASDQLTLYKSGENFNISSTLGSKVLRISTVRNGSVNNSFNFKTTTFDGVTIHSTGDDITPVRTFNTVGANHGYTSVVDLPNTNKVTADLGSVWTDGTNEFVLLRIVDGRLLFSMPYVEGANGLTVPVVNPTANLTHVRNATNTQTIAITGSRNSQLYPSTGIVVSQYKADGNLITEDGDYNADEIVVVDSYDILDYKSIVEWAKNNVGKDYANSRNSIDGVLRMSNTYSYYEPGKCLTTHSIYVLKTVQMGRTGVLQSVALQHPTSAVYRYVHNVDTVSGINFKSPINLADYNTTCYVLREHLINNTKPVDRYVDYIGSGSNKLIAFSMGHVIDKTNSKQSDRMANIPGVLWDFRSTKKSYPTVLENKILQAGDYYSFQGYRDYYIPKSSTLNSNVSSDKSADYIYIDEQSSGSFKALKDESLIGKELELIDSRNFTLLSDVADSQGIAYRTSGSNAYGVIKAK